MAGTAAGAKGEPQRCHGHPLRGQYAHHLRLCLPYHGSRLCRRTMRNGLARGYLRQPVQRYRADGGAFSTHWLRSNTPRAALLSPLAGLALAYLCLGFVFGVFQQAAIALLPMLVLFTLYGSHLKLPYRLPPGLLAIGIGAVLVAVLRWLQIYTVPMPAVPEVKLYLPHAVKILPPVQPTSILALPGDHCASRRARHSGIADDSGKRQSCRR